MAMGRELDNANPTIVNVSDLPTRRRDTRNRLASRSVDDDIRWHTSFDGIFGDSDDTSDADADEAGDPIDEQEIYGTHLFMIVHLISKKKKREPFIASLYKK